MLALSFVSIFYISPTIVRVVGVAQNGTFHSAWTLAAWHDADNFEVFDNCAQIKQAMFMQDGTNIQGRLEAVIEIGRAWRDVT